MLRREVEKQVQTTSRSARIMLRREVEKQVQTTSRSARMILHWLQRIWIA
eukprot:SAG11_NODE_5771_length_1466_cov_1.691295_2_plen_49_part_01